MKPHTMSAIREKQKEYGKEKKKAIALPCFVFHRKTESLYYGN